jgi:hypothetical protein
MRLLVQSGRLVKVAGGDHDARGESHLGEAHPAVLDRHQAARLVLIGRDLDPGARAFGQIAQHVAGRERGHEQIFRVVLGAVAAERRVGRARKRRFALDLDPVVAPVALVGSGGTALGPGPDQAGGEMMLLGHGWSSPCRRLGGRWN